MWLAKTSDGAIWREDEALLKSAERSPWRELEAYCEWHGLAIVQAEVHCGEYWIGLEAQSGKLTCGHTNYLHRFWDERFYVILNAGGADWRGRKWSLPIGDDPGEWMPVVEDPTFTPGLLEGTGYYLCRSAHFPALRFSGSRCFVAQGQPDDTKQEDSGGVWYQQAQLLSELSEREFTGLTKSVQQPAQETVMFVRREEADKWTWAVVGADGWYIAEAPAGVETMPQNTATG